MRGPSPPPTICRSSTPSSSLCRKSVSWRLATGASCPLPAPNGKAIGPAIAVYLDGMFGSKPTIGFLLATGLYGAQPGTVDVHEIVGKSVAATEANWKEAPNYGFVERETGILLSKSSLSISGLLSKTL